ncbi:inositol transporter-like SP family MFS transporter [Glaciihabitans tibetensis]|uniref:Inositol transporter-like SP family MFS transporter n=1 Tax=Glaciihabitans tibetensis TaxID=1266600 RepID=A0A2T0V9R5_9MICO|nr:MFS transporter [Glaciihabitans tibetensis]PRY66922.1 inositol transporter-like SP family MFS transporter [Glaciihabitans tibetensis]
MVRFGKTITTGTKATVAVAMSNYIEAGSIIAIATSLSLWQKEFGFDNFLVGLLAALSANAFGAAAGALIGGPLCDRYGRKFIYTYDLMLYMGGVLLAVFAGNFWMLLIAFVLTGIAVGAGVPASWTYIAEQAPAGQRAKHVGMAQLAWSVGPLVGYLLAVLVQPLGLLGSRLIFAQLFVVAFVTWWMRQGLPESAIWKDEKVKAPSASLVQGLRALFSKKANITALLFLVGVYAFWNTVAGQAGIFMPRVYEAAGVESETEQYLLQALVWGLTVLTTYFVFMKLADKYSRRILYIVGALLGIAAWAVLVFAEPTLPALLSFAVLWGVASGIGAQAFYGVWANELFATQYRASAQGILFFVARVMVGLLSVWFPILLTSIGLSWLGLLLIGLLAVALVVGGVWAPRTQGKTLQEIEKERYPENRVASASESERVTLPMR